MEQDPQPLETSQLGSNFVSLPLKSTSLLCALLSSEKKECHVRHVWETSSSPPNKYVIIILATDIWWIESKES